MANRKATWVKAMCKHCGKICVDCPKNKGHEDICLENPKNIKDGITDQAKTWTKTVNKNKKAHIKIPKEWKKKDLSRFNKYKINSPIYFDSQWNPFN